MSPPTSDGMMDPAGRGLITGWWQYSITSCVIKALMEQLLHDAESGTRAMNNPPSSKATDTAASQWIMPARAMAALRVMLLHPRHWPALLHCGLSVPVCV